MKFLSSNLKCIMPSPLKVPFHKKAALIVAEQFTVYRLRSLIIEIVPSSEVSTAPMLFSLKHYKLIRVGERQLQILLIHFHHSRIVPLAVNPNVIYRHEKKMWPHKANSYRLSTLGLATR